MFIFIDIYITSNGQRKSCQEVDFAVEPEDSIPLLGKFLKKFE